MPTFRYLTRTAAGVSQSGTMVADSPDQLSLDLRNQGNLVLEIEPIASERCLRATIHPATWRPGTKFDAEIGCQQLATMLKSGLSLLAALRTVADHARRKRAGGVWHDVADRIEQGSSLADAMAAHPNVFPAHTVQLARVGETSGNLDEALLGAARHLERSRELRITVFNAMAYPAIVSLMAIGVSAFLVFYVLPHIQKYLNGRSLPPLTQSLLDGVAWMQRSLPTIFVLSMSFLLAIFAIRRWAPGRLALDRMLLRLPVFGSVSRLANTVTFARGLSVLLQSGVTLLHSLRTTAKLLGNHAYQYRVDAAYETILRGGTLADGVTPGKEFLPLLPRMTAVGENSGTLPDVLGEVADFYEKQLFALIRRLSVLIEPVVILVVGGIVGFVYLAFFSALFSLSGLR